MSLVLLLKMAKNKGILIEDVKCNFYMTKTVIVTSVWHMVDMKLIAIVYLVNCPPNLKTPIWCLWKKKTTPLCFSSMPAFFFSLSHTYISPYICFQFPIWFMKLKLFRFLLQLRLEGVEVNEEETVSEPELLMEVI